MLRNKQTVILLKFIFLRNVECLSCWFKLSVATFKSSQMAPVFSITSKWWTGEIFLYNVLKFSPSSSSLGASHCMSIILQICGVCFLILEETYLAVNEKEGNAVFLLQKIVKIARYAKLIYISLTCVHKLVSKVDLNLLGLSQPD